MAITTSPPPIHGEPIDPAPKPTPKAVRRFEQRDDALGALVGALYRSYLRFSHANATLLAAGTTYYMFLAMFSIIAFGYGVTAWLGADQIAEYLTEAIGEAFPGLLGDDGIDPATLRAVGQTAGIIGLLGLFYGGGGAVIAASKSMHLLYGAPKDARNFVVARIIALLWLLAIGPMILVSFVASSFTSDLSDRVFEALNISWEGPGVLLAVAAVALTLGLNFAIIYLLLGNLGGIRPPRRARVIGAAVGAVITELLKSAMTLLVGFTIDQPEYGALAAPIGILFVLFLLSMALYSSAALTAGVTDKDVPLELLEADAVEDAHAAMADATGELAAVTEGPPDQARE
jgi:uncharacterized BrkB/YihY/UPF0761 family membrane protein